MDLQGGFIQRSQTPANLLLYPSGSATAFDFISFLKLMCMGKIIFSIFFIYKRPYSHLSIKARLYKDMPKRLISDLFPDTSCIIADCIITVILLHWLLSEVNWGGGGIFAHIFNSYLMSIFAKESGEAKCTPEHFACSMVRSITQSLSPWKVGIMKFIL